MWLQLEYEEIYKTFTRQDQAGVKKRENLIKNESFVFVEGMASFWKISSPMDRLLRERRKMKLKGESHTKPSTL